MSQDNLGWLFYKELYRHGSNDIHIGQTVGKITSSRATMHADRLGGYGFELETTYPGLLIGSGYTHGIKSDKDVKIGFFFDHTTGMPMIPGSTVKGVLRSMFGLPAGKEPDKYREQKETLVRNLIGDASLDVAKLGREIFEGIDPESGQPLPMYRRDRFFDAVVVAVGEDGLLEDDYITPHKDPLKDPKPIKFLKVPGGVRFRFDFALHGDENDKRMITAKQKEMLFLQLLQWHGVGAKTNVGYGQFAQLSAEKLQQEKQKQAALDAIANESPVDKIFKEYDYNTANIVSAYNQGLSERVADFKDEFLKQLLALLGDELSQARNKKKPKIEERIKKVQKLFDELGVSTKK